MPTLFVLSNLVFITLLIRNTIKGDSDRRFFYKIAACLHYLILAFWALGFVKMEAYDDWLLAGLVFAFLGDLALGLKHRSSWMMPCGMGFFLLTQVCYTMAFGISLWSLVLFVFLVTGLGIVAWRMKQNPSYDFKGMDIAVLVYAISMMMMLSTAVSSLFLTLQPVDGLKALGASLFVLSDVTLLHQYFYSPKKTRTVLVYLMLYHLGQNVLALSIWF